jgi:hypothetical protein
MDLVILFGFVDKLRNQIPFDHFWSFLNAHVATFYHIFALSGAFRVDVSHTTDSTGILRTASSCTCPFIELFYKVRRMVFSVAHC